MYSQIENKKNVWVKVQKYRRNFIHWSRQPDSSVCFTRQIRINVSESVIVFSKLNRTLLGCFHAVNAIFLNENEQFSGWPDRCFSWNKIRRPNNIHFKFVTYLVSKHMRNSTSHQCSTDKTQCDGIWTALWQFDSINICTLQYESFSLSIMYSVQTSNTHSRNA